MRTVFSVAVALVCVSACAAATCPECKRIVPDEQKFCGHCGRQVSGTVTCTKCKKPIPAGQKFCGHCGTKAPAIHAPKPKPKIVRYPPPPSVWDDQAVEKAIARAVKHLWSRQRGDGSWPSYGHYPTGATSAAVYALLESGVRVSDKRMAKALNWLGKHNTDKVYCLGLRCNAWLAADRQAPGMYGNYLLRDGMKLVKSIGSSGGWHYNTTDKVYHNSTAQYGVLGAWALARATGEVPATFWNRVQTYWYRGQHADGGWGYAHTRTSYGGNNGKNLRSCGSMSAAGLASLFVCYDALSAGTSLECRGVSTPPGLQRGLGWFDKQFYNTLHGKTLACAHVAMDAYYLYGVERVGLASGYKYFGTHDWFQMGARHLMKLQRANGAVHRNMGGDHDKYGSISETAFAIVFWVRGRYPVVMNKLEFDGDWNNRPRDLANFTRWFERRVELPVTWQIVSFASDPWKWLDSPIMYISGSKAPKFTPAQINMLGEYVRRGGTIFSVAECAGVDTFGKAMRQVYEKLFPKYRLSHCRPGHDVYSQRVLARLGNEPMIYELSNGIRPLAIHVNDDLPRAWQTYSVAAQKHAFAGAGNIICYVAGSRGSFRPRNTIPWPAAKTFKPTASVTLTRVKYTGNYDPEPLSLHRFALLAGAETTITVNIAPDTLIEDLPKSGVKIAAMTGTGTLTLTRTQTEAIRTFVTGGGLLVVDAAGGNAEFARSASQMLEKTFGGDLQSIAGGSPLLRCKGFELTKAYYRRRTVLESNMTSNDFALKGILVDDKKRLGVLFSRDDITGGLIGVESYSVDGYSSKTAYRIMRNVVLHAAGRR